MIGRRLEKCGVTRVVVFVIFAATFVGAFEVGFSQNERSIWDGVYTTEQAARGEDVSREHCVECHSEDLSGGEGSALVGEGFMLNWEGQSLDRLFRKMRETMPLEAVQEVKDNEKLDVLAYLLQENDFPPGATELTEDADLLASIKILPKGGLGAPRKGSLVQVIGCLAQGPENDWVLL